MPLGLDRHPDFQRPTDSAVTAREIVALMLMVVLAVAAALFTAVEVTSVVSEMVW